MVAPRPTVNGAIKEQGTQYPVLCPLFLLQSVLKGMRLLFGDECTIDGLGHCFELRH
jgi:hypothetical protein